MVSGINGDFINYGYFFGYGAWRTRRKKPWVELRCISATIVSMPDLMPDRGNKYK